ncbi:MAG TPA: DegV family protein [Spirochaetia bacterium]|nr:DegV family protein [Spirochaetia bacterium]
MTSTIAKISYLDGRRLKRALIAGARRVITFREQLNKINVFPVADSDTGTNMAGTLQSVVQALNTVSDRSVAVVTRTAADSALLGARGNSGTILAQFFHGMAEELKNHVTINTKAFGTAVSNAVNYAYKAITVPTEGTILTVLRHWSERLTDTCRKTTDFAKLLGDSLHAAKTSLLATRDRLPSLKKAGVVDAGAQGFVHLIEGITSFIDLGNIRDVEAMKIDPIVDVEGPSSFDAEISFRYCTECMIDGTAIDQDKLRAQLNPLGDSLIIAGSSTRTKMHIHTDEPAVVFGIARTFGRIGSHKAEDMRKQHESAHTAHADVAIVIDSACDLPEELAAKPFIQMVPLQVAFGEDVYIDKVSLTPALFYDLLREKPDQFPTTSQPAPILFQKTYGSLADHYSGILVISLSGGLSGTYSSASIAAGLAALDVPIRVVDSGNVTVGIGLIVRRIAEAAERGADLDTLESMARSLTKRTRLLVTVRTVDALVRGGRVSKTKGMLATLLDLKPIITLDAAGKAKSIGTSRGVTSGKRKIVSMLKKRLITKSGPQPCVDFAIAHVDNREDAGWLEGELKKTFCVDREIFINDAAPVLATHTGIGTLALAYIEPEQDAHRRK